MPDHNKPSVVLRENCCQVNGGSRLAWRLVPKANTLSARSSSVTDIPTTLWSGYPTTTVPRPKNSGIPPRCCPMATIRLICSLVTVGGIKSCSLLHAYRRPSIITSKGRASHGGNEVTQGSSDGNTYFPSSHGLKQMSKCANNGSTSDSCSGSTTFFRRLTIWHAVAVSTCTLAMWCSRNAAAVALRMGGTGRDCRHQHAQPRHWLQDHLVIGSAQKPQILEARQRRGSPVGCRDWHHRPPCILSRHGSTGPSSIAPFSRDADASCAGCEDAPPLAPGAFCLIVRRICEPNNWAPKNQPSTFS
eukprot:m.353166 g.353166  ORF g.353166 m.353166 type:complete len:303 (-) comp16588_c4_seq11:23-931(-)